MRGELGAAAEWRILVMYLGGNVAQFRTYCRGADAKVGEWNG